MLINSPYSLVGIYRESDLAFKAEEKNQIRQKLTDWRRIWTNIPTSQNMGQQNAYAMAILKIILAQTIIRSRKSQSPKLGRKNCNCDSYIFKCSACQNSV